jgi:hypothetical protein
VVSKMMTRSLSDLFAEAISDVLLSFGAGHLAWGAWGCPVISTKPLSAQARAPSRPSGAGKKKAANQEGGQQRGRDRGGGQSHLPRNPLDLAANQHCQTLLSPESLGQNR